MNKSTRQTPAAPVTAISSTLSVRSTVSVPPASLVYEPLVKTVLARRFVYNVLSISAAASWLLATLWTSWQLGGLRSLGILGGILNWLSPLTLFCAVIWWTFASAPIAVLRKSYLRATHSPALSPRQALLQRATERHYQYALLVTLLSSVCLALCHAAMAETVERHSRGNPKLGVWAGSKKHPYHLNGRLCFLFLSQITCAVLYWLRDVLKDRFSIHWSSPSNIFVRAFPLLLSSSSISMLMLSAASTVSSLLIFTTLRTIVLPVLYRLPVIHSLLRPFMAHFLRPTYTITFFWSHFDLIVRAFLLALTSYILWEVPSAMFNAVFSFPATATENCKDSGFILVSGIGSSDSYYQLHAFHELSLLSSESDQMASKRTVIYSDSKHSPTLWSALVRRSLLLLGADYQLFLRRGNAPAPPQALPIPAAKAPIAAEKSTTPVIRTQIYKTSYVTPIDRIADTLSSDDTITDALARRTIDAFNLPELFRRALLSRLNAIHVNITKPIALDAVASTISSATHFATSSWPGIHGISAWWVRERQDKAARKALPNKELDLMIVEVLSKMVAHSLKEDVLGYVQRDIPRVLEAMVLFLSAIEDYQVELSKFISANELNDPANHNRLLVSKEEATTASVWVDDLLGGLRTGITLVVCTFGDRLTKYRFPPRIASKLQTFADYSTWVDS